MGRTQKTVLLAAGGCVVAGLLLFLSTSDNVHPEKEVTDGRAPDKPPLADAETATELSLDSGGSVFTVRRNLLFGDFETVSPVTWPCKRGVWKSRLRALSQARLEQVPAADAQAVLGETTRRLNYTPTEGQPTELLLGEDNKLTGKTPIAFSKSAEVVWLVESTLFQGWFGSHTAQLSEQLVPLPREKVSGVQLTQANAPIFELKQDANGWTVSDGKSSGKANEAKVSVLIARLTRGLKITRFLPEKAEVAEIGGASPLSLSVTTKNGTWRASLRPTDNSGLTTLATVGSQRALLATKALEILPSSAADLLDLTLSRFNPVSVSTFQLHLGAKHVLSLKKSTTAERAAGAAAWRCLPPSPEGCRVREDRLNTTLKLFSKLSGDSRYDPTPSPETLARTRTEPSSAQLVFLDIQGRTLGDIRIGAYADDGHLYARGATPIELLDADKIKRMPSRAEDLIALDPSGK